MSVLFEYTILSTLSSIGEVVVYIICFITCIITNTELFVFCQVFVCYITMRTLLKKFAK